MEEQLYKSGKRPMVLAGNSYSDALFGSITHPGASDKTLAFDRVLAVVYEGGRLPSNHDVQLATFIYGDPATFTTEQPNVTVVQRGAATSRTGKDMYGKEQGMNVIMGAADFLKQPGTKKILKQVAQAWQAEQQEVARARQESARVQREQADAWEKAKPERDRLAQERDRERVAARERAIAHPGTFVFLPEPYVRDESRQTFVPAQTRTFFGRINGYDVEFTLPSGNPVMNATNDGATSVPEKWRFSAGKDGRRWDYGVTLDTFRDPPENLTQEDLDLARATLTTPLDLTRHPLGQDAAFVGLVRKFELERLLNTAAYEKGYSWTALQYRWQLLQEFYPRYRDTGDKQAFLKTLFDALLAEKTITGGMFDSPYKNVLKKMKEF